MADWVSCQKMLPDRSLRRAEGRVERDEELLLLGGQAFPAASLGIEPTGNGLVFDPAKRDIAEAVLRFHGGSIRVAPVPEAGWETPIHAHGFELLPECGGQLGSLKAEA